MAGDTLKAPGFSAAQRSLWSPWALLPGHPEGTSARGGSTGQPRGIASHHQWRELARLAGAPPSCWPGGDPPCPHSRPDPALPPERRCHLTRSWQAAPSVALMGAGRSGLLPALHLRSSRLDRGSEFLYRSGWQRFSSPGGGGGVGGRKEVKNVFGEALLCILALFMRHS